MLSLKALSFLRQPGFKYLMSVEDRETRRGRITACREEIDSKFPPY